MAINFLKCVFKPISGRLSENLPDIFSHNQATATHWEGEWTSQGNDADRVSSALKQCIRTSLIEKAAQQYESIIEDLPENHHWQDQFDAVNTAFFNDSYRSYHLGRYSNRELYDATQCSLSEYLNTAHNDLRCAGITEEEQFNNMFQAKLASEPAALDRWRSHRARPANANISVALRNLTAEDSLVGFKSAKRRDRGGPSSIDSRLGSTSGHGKRPPHNNNNNNRNNSNRRPANFFTGRTACRRHSFHVNSKGEHLSEHLWRDCPENPNNKKKRSSPSQAAAGSRNSSSGTCFCGSTEHRFNTCPNKNNILKAAEAFKNSSKASRINSILDEPEHGSISHITASDLASPVDFHVTTHDAQPSPMALDPDSPFFTPASFPGLEDDDPSLEDLLQ